MCPEGKERAKSEFMTKVHYGLKEGSELLGKNWDLLKNKVLFEADLTFEVLKKIGDSAHADYFHRPEGPFLDLKDSLGNYVVNINSLHHYSPYTDKTYTRIAIYNFFKSLTTFMVEKKHNPEKFKKKYILYSGHDTNISPILMYFGLPDVGCNLKQLLTHEVMDCVHKPPFASSVAFELAVNSQGDYFVFFRYNGQYYDVCSGFVPPAMNKIACPLEKFLEITDKAKFDDERLVDEFCGIISRPFKPEPKPRVYDMSSAVIMLLIAAAILGAFVLRHWMTAQRRLRRLREIVAESQRKTK
jgi:hypothetical protein